MFDCPNLAVPPQIMQHVVNVESASNPFAIGVVGGHIARQPRTLSEAVATAQMLEQSGFNFSLGVAQVNRYNLAKYGLSSYQAAFEICPNLQAGSRILRACYDRANDWGKAFSCYYSGNFVTGYRQGYVQKIFASIRRHSTPALTSSSGIPVYSNSNRRRVAIQRYPAFSTQANVSNNNSLLAQNTPVVSNGVDARYLQDPLPAGSAPVQTAAPPMGLAPASPPAETARVTAELVDTALVQSQTPKAMTDKRRDDHAFVY